MSDQVESRSSNKQILETARSRLLDGFADVEVATIGLQGRLGLKPNGASLGHRLEALRKLIAKGELEGTIATELKRHTDRLSQLNEIRGDIVHARMHVAQMAGQARAWFINSRECEAQYPSSRVLSVEQFASLNKELAELKSALTKLAS